MIYSVEGFLDKNRDTLFDDFKRLLFHSKNPILSAMWPEGEKSIAAISRRPLTAGTIFRNSMISLCNLLSSKVRTTNNRPVVHRNLSFSSNHSMFVVLNQMMKNQRIYSIKHELSIKLHIWVYLKMFVCVEQVEFRSIVS